MPSAIWSRDRNTLLGNTAEAWKHALLALTVIRSIATTKDGTNWLHVSLAHAHRIPTWDELAMVKDEFFGPEVEAYQVVPKRSEHVNLCERCLHLWAPVDGIRRVANLWDLIDERKG